jgi:hypothetical protein
MRWLLAVVLLAGCADDDGAIGLDGGAPLDAAAVIDVFLTDQVPGSTIWQPPPGTTWQWQLTGTIDTSVDAEAYDLDLFDAAEGTIATLHAANRRVICYFSAGSHEDWRPDQADFPAAAIGLELDGWPGERWLDIRSLQVRALMEARLDLAVEKGCDAVEPDNVDGYTFGLAGTGFDLTAADQLDYNRFLATQAHIRALSIGLKNDLDQIPELVADFDFHVDEECFAYDECDLLTPFIQAGKAVFHAEYVAEGQAGAVCAVTQPLQLSTIIKKLELDAFRVVCP